MTLYRNKLYVIFTIACLAGYTWLYLNITGNLAETKSADVCLFKHVTNIPCPSCGSTRSILSIAKGDFHGAFYLNPLGFLIALIMLITPLWILVDVIMNSDSFVYVFRKIETYLKKPNYAYPLIILVIANWIWNITKGL